MSDVFFFFEWERKVPQGLRLRIDNNGSSSLVEGFYLGTFLKVEALLIEWFYSFGTLKSRRKGFLLRGSSLIQTFYLT